MTADLLALLRRGYAAAADPERAAAMARYMRDQFRYFGIPTPLRRKIDRRVLASAPVTGEPTVLATAGACWELPEREFQYFAADLLVAHAGELSPDALPEIARLITTRAWWDTVDPLATRVVGAMVRRTPELVVTMDRWSREENLWLVRTAILYQLHARDRTDTERLFGYCLAQAGHRDFFVRKAIGWALRQYARTDPEAVRRFVAAHGGELSALSVREATKHL